MSCLKSNSPNWHEAPPRDELDASAAVQRLRCSNTYGPTRRRRCCRAVSTMRLNSSRTKIDHNASAVKSKADDPDVMP